MSRIDFFVTKRVNKWFVDVGNETHGPYLSERDAVADAIDAAGETASHRTSTAVLLKTKKGPAEEVWTSSSAARAAAAEAAKIEAVGIDTGKIESGAAKEAARPAADA